MEIAKRCIPDRYSLASAHAAGMGTVPGGDGGQGCTSDGKVANVSGGGGGGGGVCIGAATQQGNDGTPFDAACLPSGQAAGGASSCNAGGGGYAIVTFSA